jgi:DNA-binding FadR family transcriptional regulator
VTADLPTRLASILNSALAAPEGRLPTERALSEQLGVTRHAVRRILRDFEASGRLWRHVGRGTFAGPGPVPPAAPLDLARRGTPREVVEARRMLEPPLAAAAARHGSLEAIDQIREAHQKCRAARTLDDYDVWDEALHRAIVAAAGNSLMVGLFEAINQARKDIVLGMMRRSTLMLDNQPFFVAQHERIVAAIADRDAEAAWKRMREHTDSMAEMYARLDRTGPDGRLLEARAADEVP